MNRKRLMRNPYFLGDIFVHGRNKIRWPEGKKFAFTVFDDTDLSTLENVKEIYSFLMDHGFRTTKSVWAIQGAENALFGGLTCEDRNYLKWLYALKHAGFEIGYHNATFCSSLRDETIRGIERFKELFGYYPKTMANHSKNRENIYWGEYRVTGVNRLLYNLLSRNRYKGFFQGHIENSKYFWGDICKEKVKYVRNFVFSDINTLKACPIMPYHDPVRPYVNYWFASSEGADVAAFNKCIAEQAQDRLEQEGGACIMYTHFAKGFYQKGEINPRFKFLIKRISKKDGWFVPVGTLLDYLLNLKGHYNISDKERSYLEIKWLLHKIKVGRT